MFVNIIDYTYLFVGKSQWAVSTLIFAVLAPALVLIRFDLSLGISYSLISGWYWGYKRRDFAG